MLLTLKITETTNHEGDENSHLAPLPFLATQCGPFCGRARSPGYPPVGEQRGLGRCFSHAGCLKAIAESKQEVKTHMTTPYV